jgi:hypothetical protein
MPITSIFKTRCEADEMAGLGLGWAPNHLKYHTYQTCAALQEMDKVASNQFKTQVPIFFPH